MAVWPDWRQNLCREKGPIWSMVASEASDENRYLNIASISGPAYQVNLAEALTWFRGAKDNYNRVFSLTLSKKDPIDLQSFSANPRSSLTGPNWLAEIRIKVEFYE